LEIVVAKTAGFCFGVNKAVQLIYDLIEKTNGQIYTLGPIIHNEQLVERLKSNGVQVLDNIDEIRETFDTTSERHVVIRTHGVTPDIYESIRKKNLSMADATCPYVKKIHDLVKDKYEEGYQIIIVGDKEHPEVKGVNGWCGNRAYIVDNIEEVDELPGSEKKACAVAQTTITEEKWNSIYRKLKKKFKNLIKFDTICCATSSRQEEAARIAQTVDMMIVVGSKSSSNTQKLYEICLNYCPYTYKIETSGELPPIDIKKIKRIGVTAGASTPDWIIKEVIGKMEELNKQENEMSFKEAFESSLVTLQTGEIVKGRIIGFNNAEVYVDLGFKSDGIISMEEFSDDSEFKPEESLKIGDEIQAFVIRVNDGEGNVLLSKKKVDAMKSWTIVEEAYEKKLPVKVKVIEETNGGLIASTNGIRIFIPASQVGERFVKDLKEYLKQTIEVKIIEFNRNRKKVVGSQRALLTEKRINREGELWGGIEIGRKYTGTVKSLTDFGAFVDIGGVDGLIHVSELSWTKIKHPSEILKVGDKVEVTVLEFDKDKKRISLGYKKDEDNPWSKIEEKYKVGDIVKGKVVRLVPFGAFVELEKGVDGLVHISQISNIRIAKPGDVLEIGQEAEAKIMEINPETKKISLSIKEVNPIDSVVEPKIEAVEQTAQGEEQPSEHKENMAVTIGDMVSGLETPDEKE